MPRRSIDEKIARIDGSKRLNKKMDKRYARVEKKVEKSKSNPAKLQKIEKKYGYDYDSAIRSGLGPDESGHWGSIDPSTGRILKGKKHPSIMKTKKIERVLGNKVIKRGGDLYSVSKNKLKKG